MIVGIGTDIVKVSRVAESLDKHGSRFAKRILADAEYEQFQHKSSPVLFLAKRFAAKEAAVKALGSGFRDGISMRHIFVENDALGKPCLQFSDAAKIKIEEQQITHSHLSLADEQEYAIAYVVLEKIVDHHS